MSTTSIATAVSAPRPDGRIARPLPNAGPGEFAAILSNALVQRVEDTAAQANVAITNMVNGSGEVHDAMIALSEAEDALQLTVQVRNKFVQAYQDIMRMAV